MMKEVSVSKTESRRKLEWRQSKICQFESKHGMKFSGAMLVGRSRPSETHYSSVDLTDLCSFLCC